MSVARSSIHQKFREFSVVIQELSDPIFEREDVTPVQYSALEFITLKETIPARAIADFLKIKPAAVTSLLDRLEKKGYVERMNCSDDRRVIHISATEKGKEVYDRIFTYFTSMSDQFYSVLDEEEFDQFERIAQKLLDEAKRSLEKKKLAGSA